MSTSHALIGLRSPCGELVEIDCAMAHLIGALWARGVKTVACCEGDARVAATILFASAADLEAALGVFHGLVPAWMRACVATRHGARDRWSVQAWARLGWAGDQTQVLLDGPEPFFYELTLAPGHLALLDVPG